ncbi:hypothetical protein N0V94_002367 [Neodidymelliopsis sp. IMI 364377]|nr:hypothetical protein N0V94_002367 [Neodidymelliopsis sp. IMI 364377]
MAQYDDAKRANTVITIAQLKFKQAVKKEEPEAGLPPVTKCTEWIVKHIAPSKVRIATFGDYLVSISKSIVVDTTPAAAKKAARNRLDLLFVVNDALHTDKYHCNRTATYGLLGRESMSYLPELVDLAASCATDKGSLSETRVKAIINYWAVNQLVSEETLKSLRERADESFLLAQGGTPIRKRNYLLPEYHGDRTAPWYELPASYMLDQMIRQPNRPLDPYRIKATRFDKKPVSTHVRKLLDNYFENIDLKHTPTGDNPTGETKKYNLWLDPMGQLIKRDKETGETATVANGYGWSMKFCLDMQKDGLPESIKMAREDHERMDIVPERQREQRRYSHSPRRHRRSSSASSRGRDRDRRSRSSSYASRSSYDSRSRSRSRHHDRRRRSPQTEGGRERRYLDRDGDGRRQPSKSTDRGQLQSGGQWSAQPDRNPQSSPGNNQFPPSVPPTYGANFSQPPQPPFNAPPFHPQVPMPNQFPGQFQSFPPPPPPMPFQAPGGFPVGIPPPPPPNFSGPFPPPPPTMAAMPNNPYNFNNRYGNPYGSHVQSGNQPGLNQQQNQTQNQGYPQTQNQGHGGFQGGRGGYGGNFQGGGNYNSRGGYGGRGQWGGKRN